MLKLKAGKHHGTAFEQKNYNQSSQVWVEAVSYVVNFCDCNCNSLLLIMLACHLHVSKQLKS